jgi:hypothetical protein
MGHAKETDLYGCRKYEMVSGTGQRQDPTRVNEWHPYTSEIEGARGQDRRISPTGVGVPFINPRWSRITFDRGNRAQRVYKWHPYIIGTGAIMGATDNGCGGFINGTPTPLT